MKTCKHSCLVIRSKPKRQKKHVCNLYNMNIVRPCDKWSGCFLLKKFTDPPKISHFPVAVPSPNSVLTTFFQPSTVRAVDDINQGIRVFEVVAPIGTDFPGSPANGKPLRWFLAIKTQHFPPNPPDFVDDSPGKRYTKLIAMFVYQMLFLLPSSQALPWNSP